MARGPKRTTDGRKPIHDETASDESSEPEDSNDKSHQEASCSITEHKGPPDELEPSTRDGDGSKDGAATILMAERIEDIMNGVRKVIEKAMNSEESKHEGGDDVRGTDKMITKTPPEAKQDSNLLRIALLLIGICIGLGIAAGGLTYCQTTIGNYDFGRFIGYDGPTGRTRLDSQLSTWFDSGKRVAVINNIDRFEAYTASAFYKLGNKS